MLLVFEHKVVCLKCRKGGFYPLEKTISLRLYVTGCDAGYTYTQILAV